MLLEEFQRQKSAPGMSDEDRGSKAMFLDHTEQVLNGAANAVTGRIIIHIFTSAAPAPILIIDNHIIIPTREALGRRHLKSPGIGAGPAVDEHNGAVFLVGLVAVAPAE
jgi:hypothetical protein